MPRAPLLSIDFEGPFFTADVEATFFGNLKKVFEGIAQEGANVAREGYKAGESRRQPIRLLRSAGDRISDHIIGRVQARPSQGGRHWVSAAVVQIYNEGMNAAESRSLMAAGSIVEGRTRVLSRTRSQISHARALLSANLTAGLE